MADRDQCEPPEADWHISFVLGKTFCPETLAGQPCINRQGHNFEYGTETTTLDAWFKGPRPNRALRQALIPEGWFRIESHVLPC